MTETTCRVLFYEDGRAFVFNDRNGRYSSRARRTDHAEAFRIAMRCVR